MFNHLNLNNYKQLISNFFSLFLLQAVNYILPLLTLPYLVRVLGAEYFGVLAFVTAIISYFNIISDYGFNLTATREISVYRDDIKKIIEIFSSVMIIKFILIVFCFILMLSLIFMFDKLYEYKEVYILAFGMVIGQSLFPIWLFQGMEKMKYITYLNILSKSIFTLTIFIFVKEEGDFYLVPLLTSIGYIIVGVWSQIIIKKYFKINFQWQNIRILRHYFNESSKVFIGSLSYSMIKTSVVVVLGIVVSETSLGYFSAVEKIIRAIANLVGPIAQTIYPYVAKIYTEDKQNALYFSLKITFLYGFLCLIGCVFIYNYGEGMLLVLYGADFVNTQTVYIFNILSFFPFIYGVVHLFCSQTLLIQKKYKEYQLILFGAFLINIVFGYLLINKYAEVGGAYIMLISEFIIMVLSILYIFKGKKNENFNNCD